MRLLHSLFLDSFYGSNIKSAHDLMLYTLVFRRMLIEPDNKVGYYSTAFSTIQRLMILQDNPLAELEDFLSFHNYCSEKLFSLTYFDTKPFQYKKEKFITGTYIDLREAQFSFVVNPFILKLDLMQYESNIDSWRDLSWMKEIEEVELVENANFQKIKDPEEREEMLKLWSYLYRFYQSDDEMPF